MIKLLIQVYILYISNFWNNIKYNEDNLILKIKNTLY